MPANVVPKDFAIALKAGRLDDFFAGCTDSHRREYLKWIEEAKRPQTRKKRIELAVIAISAKSAEEAARTGKIKKPGR
jgi:uncharacterized protein YdeI (YjbR/CyaY-like superfamily)